MQRLDLGLPLLSKLQIYLVLCHKKYSVYVMRDGKRRLIHFGDRRYGQFRDKLGAYSSLDHNDEQRRRSYYARHGPAKDRDTAKYWAHRILW